MRREETDGGSLREGIMEGSLRAVDRTAWICAVDSNVFSALQESNIEFCIGRVRRGIFEIRWYRGFYRPKFFKLRAFLYATECLAHGSDERQDFMQDIWISQVSLQNASLRDWILGKGGYRK